MYLIGLVYWRHFPLLHAGSHEDLSKAALPQPLADFVHRHAGVVHLRHDAAATLEAGMRFSMSARRSLSHQQSTLLCSSLQTSRRHQTHTGESLHIVGGGRGGGGGGGGHLQRCNRKGYLSMRVQGHTSAGTGGSSTSSWTTSSSSSSVSSSSSSSYSTWFWSLYLARTLVGLLMHNPLPAAGLAMMHKERGTRQSKALTCLEMR